MYSHLFCSNMLGGAPEIAVFNPKFRKRCFLLSFFVKILLISFLNAPGVRFRVSHGRLFQYLYIRCAKVYFAKVLLYLFAIISASVLFWWSHMVKNSSKSIVDTPFQILFIRIKSFNINCSLIPRRPSGATFVSPSLQKLASSLSMAKYVFPDRYATVVSSS